LEDNSADFYYPTGGVDSANVDKAVLADMWQGIMVKKLTVRCALSQFWRDIM
jgi:hypothetical protein